MCKRLQGLALHGECPGLACEDGMKTVSQYTSLAFGLLAAAYGSKAIVSQEIVAHGSRLRGAGWSLYGTPAVIGGVLILALGLYIIWLAVTLNE